MNGELNELYNKLSKDFIEVKTRNETLWAEHEKRTSEWREDINLLFAKIDLLIQRPCREKSQFRILWTFILAFFVGLLSMVLKK